MTDRFPHTEQAQRLLELYRAGHPPRVLAAMLGFSRNYVGVLLTQARKEGLLPAISVRNGEQQVYLHPETRAMLEAHPMRRRFTSASDFADALLHASLCDDLVQALLDD